METHCPSLHLIELAQINRESICLNTFMALRKEKRPFPALNINFPKAIELLSYYSLEVSSLLSSPYSSLQLFSSSLYPLFLKSNVHDVYRYFVTFPKVFFVRFFSSFQFYYQLAIILFSLLLVFTQFPVLFYFFQWPSCFPTYPPEFHVLLPCIMRALHGCLSSYDRFHKFLQDLLQTNLVQDAPEYLWACTIMSYQFPKIPTVNILIMMLSFLRVIGTRTFWFSYQHNVSHIHKQRYGTDSSYTSRR